MPDNSDPGFRPPGATQPQYGQYGQPQYGQYGQPQYEQPQYGQPQYGQPQYGQPQYGQPQYGQPQYGQIGPPPGQFQGPHSLLGAKPGIIPLRPLSMGEIYDGAFNAIRRNFRVTLGLTLAVVAVVTIVSTVIGVLAMPWISSRFGRFASEFDDADLAIGSMSGFESQGITWFMSIGVTVATIIVTGTLVYAVGQLVLGRKPTAGEVWRKVRPRLWALIGLTFLTSLIIVLIAVVAILLVVLAAAVSAPFAVVLGIVLGIGAFLSIIAVSVLLSFAPAVLILEGTTVTDSLRRSWRLVRSNFWRVLGIELLTMLIVSFVQQVVVVPVTLMGTLLAFSNGTSLIWIVSVTIAYILGATISAAFTSAVTALLYINVRMRREGLDVELAMQAAGR